MNRRFVFLLVSALFIPFARGTGTPGDPGGDPLFRALQDELERSTARLRMENLERPYHITYLLRDSKSFGSTASFGALTDKDSDARRRVEVAVRVGDYVLEGMDEQRDSLPIEDDYDAIRHQVWLATDGAYKGALAGLARKRAFLQTTTVKDRPDDFSRAEPRTHIDDLVELEVDEDRWAETVRKASEVFRGAPLIQDSRVSLSAGAENSYYLNSEGFRFRKGDRLAVLSITATTQAEDGMPLGDYEVFRARRAAGLPSEGEIIRRARALGDRLSARVKAVRAEEYVGPILFEAPAAAEFFLHLVVDRLSDPREPLGSSSGGTPFNNRLHRRILPRFISIYDDPTIEGYNGSILLGSFPVDDDGVAPRRVTLVEEGRLRAWYMSRVPTKKIKESNGHSRGGIGGPGNVFVVSKEQVDAEAMKRALIEAAREQELSYGLRVVTLAPQDVYIRGLRGGGAYFSGQINLPSPLEVYRVYVADGREEPVRGGTFQGVTLRTLRDIMLAGNASQVYHTRRMGRPVSIVAPPILVEEMEIRGPEEEHAKLPYLRNPHFE